jgi:hypothetical protein
VPPVVLGVPRVSVGDCVDEPVKAILTGIDFLDGAGDLALEAVDVITRRRLLLASIPAQKREGSDPADPVVCGLEPVVRPVVVVLGGAKFLFSSAQFATPVGWGASEDGPVLVSFGEESLDPCRVIVRGETRVGHPEEGVENFAFRGALVGDHAAVVDVRESGDVPGVGGVA